jgi:DNA-binding transcriptional regulator YhcF (GntR family)/DNA-binding LacI/PurR family transcriptional regulator
MNKQPPAVSIAVEYLRSAVEARHGDPAQALPGIRTLATAAGVSLVTMWKAVQALKQKGAISVVQGQGIRLVTKGNRSADPAAGPLPAEKKWAAVKRLIHRDIVNGHYQPGEELPTLKEMVFRYNTCAATLNQSLKALAAEHGIIPGRHTYKIPPITGGKTHSSIIVLTRGEPSGELNTWTPWGREFLRTVDNLCAQARVAVVYYIYLWKGADCVFISENGETVADLPVGDSVLGFLVRTQGQDGLHEILMKKLARYNRFTAVSDEGACFTPPLPFSSNPRVRLFSLETSVSVGYKVAHFLLARKHRTIAFFSPFHETSWSQTRLEGITEIYESAGLTSAISSYVIGGIPFPFGYRKQVSFGGRTTENFIRGLFPELRRTGARQRIAGRLRDFLERTAEEEALRTRLFPLFKKAIADPAVTAWVCVNDRAAMPALDFLKLYAGKRRIELVSYDDTFEAFQHKITSYNFNISALVNAMISFVLYPRREWYKSYSTHPVQIEGALVERAPKYSAARMAL